MWCDASRSTALSSHRRRNDDTRVAEADARSHVGKQGEEEHFHFLMDFGHQSESGRERTEARLNVLIKEETRKNATVFPAGMLCRLSDNCTPSPKLCSFCQIS